MELWTMIVSILSGLIICIPLVIKLVQVTRESIRKGNWNELVSMVVEYMIEAEVKIDDNAMRKVWVVEMIRISASQLNYDITDAEWTKISEMIDQLCMMARTVNANTKEVQS